jgi:hypothetical protein
MELAVDEKALFAWEPTSRIVPTTRTKITARMTAYSAMSWPSSDQTTSSRFCKPAFILPWYD